MEDVTGMMNRYSGLTIPLGMLFAKGDRILDYRLHGEAMKQLCPALDLERFPFERNRSNDKKSLKIKMLEQALIEKVYQLFRSLL